MVKIQINPLFSNAAFGELNTATNVWAPVATAAYKERVSYDANGNILRYLRNGDKTSTYLMDSLGYQYSYGTNGKLTNNRLNWVKDNANDGDYAEDIDNQAADNYTYDAIGNLTKDVKEHINKIDWNVYGKIKQIDLDFVANKAKTISYSYDAAGQRIGKQVESYGVGSTAATTTVYTWYVRDASGNVMATYTSNAANSDGTLTVDERHLYGSSRLGIYAQGADAKILPAAAATNAISGNFVRGNKFFELANHLGNVLVTISDRKIAVDDGTYTFGSNPGPQGQPDVPFVVKANGTPDGVMDYYTADVVTANDYYPFGMVMPGRKFSAGNAKFRYGFNGKENDNEISGEGNKLDFGARIYDPRLGRWLSVDPKERIQPFISPYVFVSNRPLWSIDKDGNLDFVINYTIKNLDGSITQKTYTRTITTFEDIKGIVRTPVVIDVHYEWVMAETSPGVKQPVYKNTKTEVVKSSGLTTAPLGEEAKRTDKLGYYGGKLMFSLSSIFGAKQFVTAMEGRDQETGEYLSQGRKIGEVISGVISLITLGRSAASGKAKELIGNWALDFFVENTAKVLSEDYLSKQFGWDSEQTSVFVFNLGKLIYDGKNWTKNKLAEKLVNWTLGTIKLGTDGVKAVEELKKNFGIDINLPKDKKAATELVLKNEGLTETIK